MLEGAAADVKEQNFMKVQKSTDMETDEPHSTPGPHKQNPQISNDEVWRHPETADKFPGEQPAAIRLPGWRRQKRANYVPVKAKFLVSTVFSCLWSYVSWELAQPWVGELANVTGYWPALTIIFFIALLPGFLNAHILASVILDRPPKLHFDLNYPTISLLIAAYNEEENITETIRGIKSQDYPAGIEIIVVDDGSNDNTVDLLQSLGLPNLKVVKANHGGKARALNEGLKHIKNDIVVCIDADTYLQPQALRRIVARFLTDPPNTGAVAGCVLVKNSRSTFMTRLQEWDYFTGIASAKRQQSLYQGTLVAQGAFSAFHSKVVKAHQGWPSVIGEDIVFTWSLIKSGWRIGFEPTAIGFTSAPETIEGFYHQRKRWARGIRFRLFAWRGSGIPRSLLHRRPDNFACDTIRLSHRDDHVPKTESCIQRARPHSAAEFGRLHCLHAHLSSDHVAHLCGRLCPGTHGNEETLVSLLANDALQV